MTHKEAECFRALRRWQRVHLRHRFASAFVLRPPFSKQFKNSGMIVKLLIILMITCLLPILVLAWLLNILRHLLIFPFSFAISFIAPPDIRPPGERNIKGVHYQFARHIHLPPELYIQCVDDWVSILYGPNKLPQYSLKQYLDTEYLLRRRVAYADDASLNELIKTQISNAREDLSKDLGHY